MLRLTNKALRHLRDNHGLDFQAGVEAKKLADTETLIVIFAAASGTDIDAARATTDDMTPGELVQAVSTAIKEAFKQPTAGGEAAEASTPKSEA